MKLRVKRIAAVLITTLSIVLLGWTFFEPNDRVKYALRRPLTGSLDNFNARSRTDAKANAPLIVDDEDFDDNAPSATVSKRTFKNVDCLINDEYSVGCVKSADNSVYLPFSFIHKYFDVSGKLSKRADGSEYFSWQHSYSKVYYPRNAYDPRDVFLWFDNYNVEVRDRVKYVSAISGVPISSQWKPEGHA